MKKITEHFTMMIIAWLLWLIIYLLLQNSIQQNQFMKDRDFYMSWLTNTLSFI